MKNGYLMMPPESIRDILLSNNKEHWDIEITKMSIVDGYLRLDLEGDSLPDYCEEDNQRVRLRISKEPGSYNQKSDILEVPEDKRNIRLEPVKEIK